MDLLRISLVQLNIIWENPEKNREKLTQLLSPLKGHTDLIVLPEMFSTGFTMNVDRLAETMDGPTVQWMKSCSEELQAAIAGTLIISEKDHYYNRLIFVAPDGDLQYYDKKHLFSMGEEHLHFQPGAEKVIVTYLGWRIALNICYDLRFPVWCRCIKEADLILFPANWPAVRKHVWQTLLKARALENQVYVAGVNAIGKDGMGIQYDGESLLINAKGFALSNLENSPDEITTTTISLNELQQFRKKFPLAADADDYQIL